MRMTDAACRNLFYSALIRQTVHGPPASSLSGADVLQREPAPRPCQEVTKRPHDAAIDGGGDGGSRSSSRISG